ncbi:MAG: metallophosphoesterase [Nocardioidaceae bacterium]
MRDDGGVLVIAHLSDTHFGGRWSPADRARRVLDHVAALHPPVDVVLVTGDIADHGTTEEYDEAAAVLGAWAGPAPMLVLPGNHDRREGYAAWRGAPADRPVNEAHRVGGVLFLMADSMVPAPEGERIDHGVLTEETLAWLDTELAARAPGERAVVCLHHPPVEIHIELMDPIRLVNAHALAAVLDRHDHVVAVLTGHAHSACATSYDVMHRPLPVLIPGGVASTVTLDAEPFPDITGELAPTFAIHFLSDDGSLVTHWRSLDMPTAP